jgi:cyclic beta-1,2-glucan synthetase
MQKRFVADPLLQATLLLLQERIPSAPACSIRTIAELSRRARRAPAARKCRCACSTTPTPHARSAAALQRPLPRHGDQRRRRLQPLERPGRDALARGRHARPLGHVLLPARRGQRRLLVGGAPAHRRRGRTVRGDLFRRPCRIPRRNQGDDYETHTESRSRRRRHRTAPGAHHQPLARRTRTIEVTSYAEVVLATPAADALHPAFSNLFVQTEIVRDRAGHPLHAAAALPRSAAPWMFHLMPCTMPKSSPCQLRDRPARFLGRAPRRAPGDDGIGACPADSDGSVLDPIVAIRCRITLAPEQAVRSTWCTGVGEIARGALRLVDKYQDRRLADRVFDLAWTHSQVCCARSTPREADAQLYGRLANSVMYANAGAARRQAVHAAEPARPVRALGLRHLRRPAHRAGADRRPGQHRTGAPAGAGPCLLAPERAGRRPGDLERGPAPATASSLQDQILGLVAAGPGGQCDRPAGRHLRALGGADFATRTAS